MGARQLEEAKQGFSQVVRRAFEVGPPVVDRLDIPRSGERQVEPDR